MTKSFFSNRDLEFTPLAAERIYKIASFRSARFSLLFIYLFIDIFKEGSLISDPALLSIRALYIQNTNTTRFKNYKQDTLEYISNGKITKKSIEITYKAQVILPIK